MGGDRLGYYAAGECDAEGVFAAGGGFEDGAGFGGIDAWFGRLVLLPLSFLWWISKDLIPINSPELPLAKLETLL